MPPTNRRIAQLRHRANIHYLTQVCDIQQQDAQTDITGGTITWTTQHSDVRCRLILQRQFARNEVIDLAGLEIIGELYVLALPQEYILTSNTRILTEGLYYDIVNAKQQLTDKTFNLYVVTRQIGLS